MNQLPDFDAVYDGAPMLPGGSIAPWNIGGPQPVLAKLLAGLESPVLDAGCGIGETSLALAALGARVIGIDLSPTAIRQAMDNARERGPSAEFVVGDITNFSGHDAISRQ
ncbi:MAG TPA: class I SAM-dependent methyltransferase [Trebonia sp.]